MFIIFPKFEEFSLIIVNFAFLPRYSHSFDTSRVHGVCDDQEIRSRTASIQAVWVVWNGGLEIRKL